MEAGHTQVLVKTNSTCQTVSIHHGLSFPHTPPSLWTAYKCAQHKLRDSAMQEIAGMLLDCTLNAYTSRLASALSASRLPSSPGGLKTKVAPTTTTTTLCAYSNQAQNAALISSGVLLDLHLNTNLVSLMEQVGLADGAGMLMLDRQRS